ncbi:hypothetical protein [Pseudomonas sp. H9]|uniref:hypothetical protein n=1 Tax=Pseudomonas sp. H9 TaxID=483968 RepID=UPI001057F917|nr:hypothetical protein [Pseudomonas sp. H9]TDF78406.1 hypothetical protein E1573_24115 [Pseudomonas sp. H9]
MYKLTSTCFALCLLSFNAQASTGPRTAAAMQKNFDATPQHCGSGANAAYECSGVLIRSTRPSPAYHTWHHSENSKTKGSVSFSYLRADIPITRLAEDGRSGFTLYPQQQKPQGALNYEVLCTWPTDGDSWTRDTRGCGDNSRTTSTEALCHKQGVTSAEDWIANFRRTGDYKHQCAFDAQHATVTERANAFYQGIRTKQLFRTEMPYPWNEVMVGAWDESKSSTLPIQSFFYIAGLINGLEQARADQQDWFDTNGTFIPVIRIQLPQTPDGKTTFHYRDTDQAVTAAL